MSDIIEVPLSVGGSVRGTPENIALALKINQEMQESQKDASATLRAQGVKAEHPDDGWVNREKNTVRLEYPRFNDKPQVGDLIALGWPWRGYRLVRVTELNYLGSKDPKILSFYGMSRDEPWSYSFEPIVEEVSEEEFKASLPWWKRWFRR